MRLCIAAIALSLLSALAFPASAQTLYRARTPTIGCVSQRAAAALSSNDPRMGDPGWVNYVMNDGQCVQVTPRSEWSLIARSGTVSLMQNVVPGSSAQFYIPRAAMVALGEQTPRPTTSPAPAQGTRWTATSETALAITGDITFSPTRITFKNGRSINLQYVGPVTVPDFTGGKATADLYRVTSTNNPVMLGGNYLCGRTAPRWVTVRSPPKLTAVDIDPKALDVYETAQPPPEGGNCANFNYDAGAAPKTLSR